MEKRWFYSSVILNLFSLHCVLCQVHEDQKPLEEKFNQLRHAIQIAGNRNDYPQVEYLMDSMIPLMDQMGFPDEEITKRVHLRIRYSLSVNRIDSAYNAAQHWLKDHSDDIAVWQLLANITQRMNRFLEAREAFKKVYEDDPSLPARQQLFLHVLNVLEDREESLKVCDQILQSQTTNIDCLIEVSETYFRFIELEQAQQVLESIALNSPEHQYIPYGKAKLQQEKGEYEAAIAMYAQVPKTSPYWYDSTFRTGLCYSQLRKFADSAFLFVDLLSRNPYDLKLYTNLEQAIARMRKRNGAMLIRNIRQTLDKQLLAEGEAKYHWRSGDMVEYGRLMAISLNQKGLFHEAEKTLKDIMDCLPESIQAKKNLARHYLTTLQACKAEAIYESSLGLVSEAGKDEIQVNLAEVQLRQDKPEKPIELLQGLPSNKSELHRSLQTLIGSYFLDIKGDPVAALHYLKDVSSASPEVLSAKARSFYEAGQTEKALELFNRIPDGYDDPRTNFTKVCCLMNAGLHQQAIDLYDHETKNHTDLSALLTVPARACLASITDVTSQQELRDHEKQIQQSIQKIRGIVIQANRIGLPESVPFLWELSSIYKELGDTKTALSYAQRALAGAPARLDIRMRIIELMSEPEQIFERLHQIHLAKNHPECQSTFEPEITQSLSYLELNSIR